MNAPLRLAVVGDPVDHSASPGLHRSFLAQARLAGSYEAIRIAAGDGARGIAELRERGYTGLNVTTPLKEEAYAVAQRHDAAALASRAVNTLVFGDRIDGYNTDGIGALGALGDAGLVDLAGAAVLVLGAGPTARATIAALVGADAAVFVWNRSPQRAAEIVRDLGAHPHTPGLRPDAVFATLPPGAVPDDVTLLETIAHAPAIVDANYGARSTLGSLLHRDDVFDGSAMLRHSAAAAFALFIST